MCYANPKYVGIELHNLHSYDINSMYPACMIHYYLPYGYAMYKTGNVCDNLKENQLAVQRIKCSYELKPNCIPSLFKNRFTLSMEKHSTTSNNYVVELVLTNLDIELLFDNYYVADVQWLDGYVYNAVKGYELTDEEFKTLSYQELIERDGKGSLFYDYIKEFRVIKENSTGALRDIAKFMQNMLYGNFGKNIDGIIKLPYLKEDGTLGYNKVNTGETRCEYVPMATFITSQCRYHLIKDIKANIDNFVYCDTDSMYLLDDNKPVDLRISNNLYGSYKIEKAIKRMKVLGSKRYILEGTDLSKSKTGLFVSCCGAPKEVRDRMTFENFQYEATFDGKRQVKTVKGGKHIVSTTYKIKKEL